VTYRFSCARTNPQRRAGSCSTRTTRSSSTTSSSWTANRCSSTPSLGLQKVLPSSSAAGCGSFAFAIARGKPVGAGFVMNEQRHFGRFETLIFENGERFRVLQAERERPEGFDGGLVVERLPERPGRRHQDESSGAPHDAD
jgi:hypothetical protein